MFRFINSNKFFFRNNLIEYYNCTVWLAFRWIELPQYNKSKKYLLIKKWQSFLCKNKDKKYGDISYICFIDINCARTLVWIGFFWKCFLFMRMWTYLFTFLSSLFVFFYLSEQIEKLNATFVNKNSLGFFATFFLNSRQFCVCTFYLTCIEVQLTDTESETERYAEII